MIARRDRGGASPKKNNCGESIHTEIVLQEILISEPLSTEQSL